MANRLFGSNAVKGTVGKGFRAIQDSSREYSSQGWRRKNTYVQQLLFGNTQIEKHTVWPDPHLGCLGPKDQRLSLPGNIGLDKALLPSEVDAPPTPERLKADKEELESQARFWKSLLGTPTNHQRQLDVVKQDEENERKDAEEMEAIGRKLLGINENLECVAQACPDLLRRELAGLFTNVNIADGPLTAITFCQRTDNDMTSWSPSVEEERDALTEKFIRAAKEVCEKLRAKSQWADFIEPTSGRPYYGSFTNLTFFETDERYRHLGFRIQDLGCCKVIAHHKWGTHAFVGTIFTSAPHDCEYLQQIVELCNTANAEAGSI
jgi:hypothetical protein